MLGTSVRDRLAHGTNERCKLVMDTSMYCSVPLELLSDDNCFLKEIKSKARIAKDTFFEDNGSRTSNLQPENGAFNWDRFSQFEKKRSLRIKQGSTRNGATVLSEE